MVSKIVLIVCGGSVLAMLVCAVILLGVCMLSHKLTELGSDDDINQW